jgi:hypothetical protein
MKDEARGEVAPQGASVLDRPAADLLVDACSKAISERPGRTTKAARDISGRGYQPTAEGRLCFSLEIDYANGE